MKRLVIVLGLLIPAVLVSSCCCMRNHHETAEMKLCAECGMESGAKGCCDPAAARCAECGMIEGSPGCCKSK